MSRFTGPLIIEEVIPGRRWRLAQPLAYECGIKGSGRWVDIPENFTTDGATLPAILRLFLAVWGTYGRAALLHDYTYYRLSIGAPLTFIRDRAAADREFLKAMLACGTARWLAWTMWVAVRLFGKQYISDPTGPVL